MSAWLIVPKKVKALVIVIKVFSCDKYYCFLKKLTGKRSQT